MRFFVTGAAGFIGSNVVDRLLADGHEVVGYDNLATGQREFLAGALCWPSFNLIQGDVLDSPDLGRAMRGTDVVIHLAANADVRFGLNHPRRDLEQNAVGTLNVLESMRQNSIGRIVFSSTGSVYGEPQVFPTPEDAPFPVQTSLYGASKLACEGMLSAYCEGFGFRAYIFRFVSILGERYSHGHVFDFVKALHADPYQLRVLGDGNQRKSYLYVADCVNAMMIALDNAQDAVNIFNVGTEEYCRVDDSVRWISERLGLSPVIEHTGGERGWAGDSPFIFLDCSRIRSLGWKPTVSIREGIEKTVDYLEAEHWVMEARTS